MANGAASACCAENRPFRVFSPRICGCNDLYWVCEGLTSIGSPQTGEMRRNQCRSPHHLLLLEVVGIGVHPIPLSGALYCSMVKTCFFLSRQIGRKKGNGPGNVLEAGNEKGNKTRFVVENIEKDFFINFGEKNKLTANFCRACLN